MRRAAWHFGRRITGDGELVEAIADAEHRTIQNRNAETFLSAPIRYPATYLLQCETIINSRLED